MEGYKFFLVINKSTKKQVEYFLWLKTFINGRFLNIIIPQSGNVYRGIFLKREYGITYLNYFTIYAILGWTDIVLNLALACAVLGIFGKDLLIGNYPIWELFLYLLITIISVTYFLFYFFKNVEIKFFKKKYQYLKERFNLIYIEIIKSVKDIKLLAKISLAIFLNLVRTCIAIYFYFSIFDINISFPIIMLYYVIIKSCVIVNITPGNIGIQEILYGFVSENIGIGMAQGIMVSGTIRIFTYLGIFFSSLFFGGMKILTNKKLIKSLKETNLNQ